MLTNLSWAFHCRCNPYYNERLAAPETVVAVPTSNLIMHDITMHEIAMAISEEVSADPAGDVDGANARVRTGVESD